MGNIDDTPSFFFDLPLPSLVYMESISLGLIAPELAQALDPNPNQASVIRVGRRREVRGVTEGEAEGNANTVTSQRSTYFIFYKHTFQQHSTS